MRLIKMLGLTAMAAMVAMAFIGASSASAKFNTVLCAFPELNCENPVNGGGNVEIHLETLKAEPPVLLTSIGNVSCATSVALITLLNKLAKAPEKQLAHLLNLEFNECTLGSTGCTVTLNETGGLLVLKIGELEASIVSSLLEGKNTVATVKCGSFINCKYSASESTLLFATSDAQGHFLAKANGTPLAGSGFLCPKEAKWDANYHAVNLDAELSLRLGLYIES